MRLSSMIRALVMTAILSIAAPGFPTDIMCEEEPLPGTKPKRKLPKRQSKTANYIPHPAMPDGGWPETRQQRRAKERAAK